VKWTRGAGPLEKAYEEMETPTVSEAPPLFPLMEIPLKLEIDAASAVKRVWDPKPVASRGRREVWFIIDNPPLRLIVSFQGVDPL
jgi:hypothetical protein